MRSIRTHILAGVTALTALLATAAAAHAVTVDFSMTDGTNTVTGYLTGLTDNSTGAASGIYVTGATAFPTIAGYTYGTDLFGSGYHMSTPSYSSALYANSVTLSNGTITDIDINLTQIGTWTDGILSLQINHFTPALPPFGTYRDSLTIYNSGSFNTAPNDSGSSSRLANGLTSTVNSESSVPAPEPASLALLGAGLVGLAASHRRA